MPPLLTGRIGKKIELPRVSKGVARTLAMLGKYPERTAGLRDTLRRTHRWFYPVRAPAMDNMDQVMRMAAGRIGSSVDPKIRAMAPELLSAEEKAMLRRNAVDQLREMRHTVFLAGVVPPVIGFGAAPTWDATKYVGGKALDMFGGGDTKEAYSAGFLQKCAEYGVEPEHLLTVINTTIRHQ